MARIRTIKPEFFRNVKLYRAEIEEQLPLRLAFAGLWTACDRAGRFKWCPEELKLDALPFDQIDFSRVLDALTTRGYVVKYRVGDDFFGCIPSWDKHQVINNREKDSEIPDLHDGEVITDASSTREPRVTEIAQGKGKGKEGKGKEGEGSVAVAPDAGKPARPTFVKPTLDEIRAYCIERKNSVDPEKWLDHYSSNGWRVGPNPMKDWKAAVRTWERSRFDKPAPEEMTDEQREARIAQILARSAS